jgi:cytochrome P450
VSLRDAGQSRLTRDVLDAAAQTTAGDFVQDVSARITIAVIAEMLGVPRRDWELLFRWTNEVIAPQDPEFQRGHTAEETIQRARLEVFAYFHELAERRRVEPTDDIVSVIANGQLNGAPLAPVELLSYYFLLVVAGNETTRNAMTGGLLAFLEHPDEWQKLRVNPALLDTAVEEICAGQHRSSSSRAQPPVTTCCVARPSVRVRRCASSTPRGTATRMCSPIHSLSASIASRTRTSASEWASTSA